MNQSPFSKSLGLTSQLLKAELLPLALLFAFSTALNISAQDAIATLSAGEENTRMGLHIGVGIWELFEGVLLILLLSYGIPKVRNLSGPLLSKPFDQPYLSSFFAEYLRMLAQILLWGLLLLIPGFVRYGQLMFVPFIALFSKQYASGQVDALQFSKKLTKKYLPVILSAFFLSTVGQLAVEFAPQLIPGLYTIAVRAIGMALGFLIAVWTYCFMFVLFENALEA